MFKRKDALRSMFLLLLIVTIMITLSQILVVHQHNHQEPKQRDVSKLKSMLRELEKNIDLMLKKNVLPLDKYLKSFQALVYSRRIAAIVERIGINNFIAGKLKADIDTFKEYLPSIERKTRLLQTLDVTNLSNGLIGPLGTVLRYNCVSCDGKKDKTGSYKLPQSRQVNSQQIANNMNSIMFNDRKNLTAEFEFSQSSLKTKSLKSNLIKGKTWLRYKYKLSSEETKKRPYHKCPEIPNGLGPLKVDLSITENQTVGAHHGNIQLGGAWQPDNCVSRHHVAIVIPYRDRWNHLRVLLHYLIPVLQRQQIKFRIFVVEQHGNGTFNKGRLMNAAFKEAWKMDDFDCFIFHDVDLIPEDDRNMYTCPTQPRHMSPSVDKFNYVLPYKQLVGGVFSIRREHFQKVNGYSNLYWGWGAEDDDMFLRMNKVGLKLIRPAAYIGRYKMIRHTQREVAPAKWRQYLLKTVKKRFLRDGLNSVEYNVTFINNTAQFTHIMVDVGLPPTEVPNISAMMH